MDPIDYPPDQQHHLPHSLDFGGDANSHSHRFSSFYHDPTWPLPLDHHAMAHAQQNHDVSADAKTDLTSTMAANTASLGIRTSMAAAPSTSSSMAPLQTAGFAFSQAIDPSAALLTSSDLSFNLLQGQHGYEQDSTATTMDPLAAFTGSFGMPLQTSPIDDLVATTQEQINNSLASSYLAPFTAPMNQMADIPFQFNEFNTLLANNGFSTTPPNLHMHATNDFNVAPNNPNSSSAEGHFLDTRSFSSRSDTSWSIIDMPHGRSSLDGFSDVSNGVVSPQNLHVRTDSSSSQDSDLPLSAHSGGSFEEIFSVSPEPDAHHGLQFPHGLPHGLQLPPSDVEYHYHSPLISSPMPLIAESSTLHAQLVNPASVSSSASPSSSGAASPPSKRRNSPVSPPGVTPKAIVKKSGKAANGKEKSEKKVGKRRGPLKPEQRQQAHEIRKLRACLRCKFLKKVCDKGEPCGGCKPAHARLWQVPCTRIDIKDIAYFLKDWKADYERHVTLEVSVANIKGFSQHERMIYVTHGYGFFLPVPAREVYVRDESCFGVDWVESIHETPRQFEITTNKLSAGMEGISHHMLSEYIDCHLDQGFDRFVDEYFEGTLFLSEMLKSIHRYYLQTKLPVIRKGLKLVIAYALTLHITLINGLADDEAEVGRIDDPGSRYHGQTCAPVMINFQVKKAMADMWRELMKDILEELSTLYSSVYSGEKLKNWPTIFILAILILAVWEMMQFDQHYRVPDDGAVKKFCNEMESVPVGVIVGLFCAISTKLPSFLEWDTRKHANVLNNNMAACDTMSEVRSHVEKYGNCCAFCV